MTNPHAGGGKGMYFIPEKGEEVFIGFEDNNAEKPFVLGAVYNGSESSGYATSGNDFKVIKTRSGHHLTFEELKNITLANAKGNFFHIDSENDTLNITAINTLNINAQHVNINATQTMNTIVGGNNSTNIGGINTSSIVGASSETVGGVRSIAVTGDMIKTIGGSYNKRVEGNYDTKTEKERNEVGINGVSFASEENIEKHSDKKVNMNSSEKTTQF